MAKYVVTVYRQGYVRVETRVEVEADSADEARAEALSGDLDDGMDIIRNDLEMTDVDVSEVL